MPDEPQTKPPTREELMAVADEWARAAAIARSADEYYRAIEMSLRATAQVARMDKKEQPNA